MLAFCCLIGCNALAMRAGPSPWWEEHLFFGPVGHYWNCYLVPAGSVLIICAILWPKLEPKNHVARNWLLGSLCLIAGYLLFRLIDRMENHPSWGWTDAQFRIWILVQYLAHSFVSASIMSLFIIATGWLRQKGWIIPTTGIRIAFGLAGLLFCAWGGYIWMRAGVFSVICF
jgi:hypothetical protein